MSSAPAASKAIMYRCAEDGSLGSEEHVFKVFIDAMLVDGADHRVFGREVLQFVLPMDAAVTFASGSTRVDEPLDVASVRWVSVAEALLAVAQDVRIVPQLVVVVRVSAVISQRL